MSDLYTIDTCCCPTCGLEADDVVGERDYRFTAKEYRRKDPPKSKIPRGYVPNHKFWDRLGHTGCTLSWSPKEDEHAGMIYNPYTDEWSWL